MIQQLIISGVVEDRKLSITGGGLLSDHSTSPFLATSATNNSITASSPSTSLSPATEPPQQNLRCPRCDSPNTKFCYYNNYNLTQPRHFCKTCRRYWTKGGALRNVPIGGGCRKAKPGPIISSAATAKPGSGITKPTKPFPSLDYIARAGLGLEPTQTPTLWAAPPNTSHLLALLRASGRGGTQNPNTNPLQYCLNPIKSREDAMAEMGFPGLSLDPLGQFSTAAGTGSLWRNHEGQLPYLQNPLLLQAEHNPPSAYTVAEVQELYHRMRLPKTATAYCSDQLSMNNGWSAPATASVATGTALDPSLGGEFGYWNPALAWSDMSTTN